MTRVKICGITNHEDARAAVDYGADALGFIFVEGTPRYIGNDKRAVRIPWSIPPFVRTVAVYRDVADVHSRWDRNFGLLQIYGNRLGVRLTPRNRVIWAARIRDDSSLSEIEADKDRYGTPFVVTCAALILDAYHPDKLGGSGESFNWDLAIEAKKRFGKPIILAGGLTPDNVQQAIEKVRPYAVDVSSGVECEPGRKDHAKLKAFIKAVRRTDE